MLGTTARVVAALRSVPTSVHWTAATQQGAGLTAHRPLHNKPDAPDGASGVAAEPRELTEEEKEISRANLAESHAAQVKQMKAQGADRTGFRDPDPDSGVNLAGTVTGTIDEFESPQKLRRINPDGLQDPEDRAAKEAYARSIGYQPPGSQHKEAHPNPSDEAEAARQSASEESTRSRPFPEVVAHKVKTFVKESLSTLSHGVNNAGQPEVQEKLKGP